MWVGLVVVGSVIVGCWWLRREWRADLRRQADGTLLALVAAQNEARAYGRMEGMCAQIAPEVGEDPPRLTVVR